MPRRATSRIRSRAVAGNCAEAGERLVRKCARSRRSAGAAAAGTARRPMKNVDRRNVDAVMKNTISVLAASEQRRRGGPDEPADALERAHDCVGGRQLAGRVGDRRHQRGERGSERRADDHGDGGDRVDHLCRRSSTMTSPAPATRPARMIRDDHHGLARIAIGERRVKGATTAAGIVRMTTRTPTASAPPCDTRTPRLRRDTPSDRGPRDAQASSIRRKFAFRKTSLNAVTESRRRASEPRTARSISWRLAD